MLASKLKIGDTIGVVAPDKALKSYEKEYLDKATIFFKSLGLNVIYGKYIFSDDNYCAGTSKERAEDINNMFSNKDVKAIFTVKGGNMANGVLPFIDYEIIKNNPKIFLGMSDITVLLCAINKVTGLITYHCNDYIYYGKEKVTEYDKYEIKDKLFNGNKTIIPYEDRVFINVNENIVGKSYGTNANCLLKLAGTPYMPDLNNAVLFLEGYHPGIVEWNSFLEQFIQIGGLNNGVIFGYIYQLQCVEKNKDKIEDELMKINPSIPMVKTNDFGHRHPNSIVPIGVDVEINPVDKSIIILEDFLQD